MLKMALERGIVIMKRIHDFFNENLYREMKCNRIHFYARILFLSDSIPFSFHSNFILFSFHFHISIPVSFDEKWNEHFKK